MDTVSSVVPSRRPSAAAGIGLLCALLAGGANAARAQSTALRGDANGDGRLSLTDSLWLGRYVSGAGEREPCPERLDLDANGEVEITDHVLLVRSIFGETSVHGPFLRPGPRLVPEVTCTTTPNVAGAQDGGDRIRLAAVEGAPGAEVEVPVLLSSNRWIQAVQLVVRYEPSVFRPRFGPDGLAYEGTFYEHLAGDIEGFVSVQRLSEDVLLLGFIPHFIDDRLQAPPGRDRSIFKLRGSIAPDATPGTEVLLEPINGPAGLGLGAVRLRNELAYESEAGLASSVPDTLPGILKIVPDITIFQSFLRGDSNRDLSVNVADAVLVLAHLFLEADALACPDAADATDDGVIDLLDPLAVLFTTFLGEARIQPPYPALGPDRTADGLERCRYH